MSANQMDYFNQKPDLDLKPFFEGKRMKLDGPVPVEGVGAPPPKDSAWCSTEESAEEEELR